MNSSKLLPATAAVWLTLMSAAIVAVGLDGAEAKASGSEPVASVPRETQQQTALSTLEDVTVAQGPSAERLTFSFDGDVPHFEVSVPDSALQECESENDVDLAGSTSILVSFEGATAAIDTTQIPGAGKSIIEARQVCDADGTVSWAVGVPGAKSFELMSEGESRLTLIVRH